MRSRTYLQEEYRRGDGREHDREREDAAAAPGLGDVAVAAGQCAVAVSGAAGGAASRKLWMKLVGKLVFIALSFVANIAVSI